jgi:hypothetical protein
VLGDETRRSLRDADAVALAAEIVRPWLRVAAMQLAR